MAFFIVSFLSTFITTLFVIKLSKRHFKTLGDTDLNSPQKFHAVPVPRVGGVSIFLGMIIGIAFAGYMSMHITVFGYILLLCAIPAFFSGLAEDITKNISPRRRIFFTALSSALGILLLDIKITRSSLPPLDYILQNWAFLAACLTLLVVTGVANAINIIDGFNGLAAMCLFMMVLAISYVAFRTGDQLILVLSLISAGAILGFFVWNYPGGLIFLGDGGAYFLGFILAEIGILLVARNPEVSPMFPILLCLYPIFETLFSMYRKKLLRGVSPSIPDGIHLHMLVYKRLIRWAIGNKGAKALTRRNSMTSPYLWVLCLMSIMPAVLWWNNTEVLFGFIVLFMFSYVVLYWKIVRFRIPKWMVYRN